MGGGLGVSRGIAVGLVAAAVLVFGVAMAWVVTRSESVTDRRDSAAATTTLPLPPEDWPELTPEQAASITSYLEGPGADLDTLLSATRPLLGDLSETTCGEALDDLDAIEPNAALAAATGVPDAPLSQMFVNLTGQITAVLGTCQSGDPAASAEQQKDLATMESYISARLAQVEGSS